MELTPIQRLTPIERCSVLCEVIRRDRISIGRSTPSDVFSFSRKNRFREIAKLRKAFRNSENRKARFLANAARYSLLACQTSLDKLTWPHFPLRACASATILRRTMFRSPRSTPQRISTPGSSEKYEVPDTTGFPRRSTRGSEWHARFFSSTAFS